MVCCWDESVFRKVFWREEKMSALFQISRAFFRQKSKSEAFRSKNDRYLLIFYHGSFIFLILGFGAPSEVFSSNLQTKKSSGSEHHCLLSLSEPSVPCCGSTDWKKPIWSCNNRDTPTYHTICVDRTPLFGTNFCLRVFAKTFKVDLFNSFKKLRFVSNRWCTQVWYKFWKRSFLIFWNVLVASYVLNP